MPAVAPAPAPAPAPLPVDIQPIPLVAPAQADVEADPPPAAVAKAEAVVDLPVAVEPVALETVAAPGDPAREQLDEVFAATRSEFRVVVRLKDGEGVVEVGSFRDFGTAMEGAQEVIEQVAAATESRWPFYAGRFIRPDLIVSVDLVEGEPD